MSNLDRQTRSRGQGISDANAAAAGGSNAPLQIVAPPANAANAMPDQAPNWLAQVIQSSITAAVPAILQAIIPLQQPAPAVANDANSRLLARLDESLMRQLTSIPMFDGSDSRPWEDFQQEFKNKANQIKTLPKTEWVLVMHSRICDRALEFAISKDLADMQGNLLVTDFEQYCKAMGEGLFANATSITARIQMLASLTQTGKLKNVMDYMRAAEKILNQIPSEEMAGRARAALTLMGMDQAMLAAISPNPGSPDGLYHSFADVRKQVVAVLALNQQLLNAAAAANNQQTQSNQPFLAKQKGNLPAYQNKTDKGHSPQVFQGNKRSFPTTNTPAAGNGSDGAGSAQPSESTQPKAKLPNPKYADAVCPDCGQKGHASAGYYKCPKHPGNNKGKEKASK